MSGEKRSTGSGDMGAESLRMTPLKTGFKMVIESNNLVRHELETISDAMHGLA